MAAILRFPAAACPLLDIVPDAWAVSRRILKFLDHKFFVRPQLKLKNTRKTKKKKIIGESGYRSRYLPHAKRALYHLS